MSLSIEIILQSLSVVLIMIGTVFFVAGTLGLLRFPDVYTRLHALTKADNVGLGFVVAGLILQAATLTTALLLIFIWLLVMLAGASGCQLIAQAARQHDVPARNKMEQGERE